MSSDTVPAAVVVAGLMTGCFPLWPLIKGEEVKLVSLHLLHIPALHSNCHPSISQPPRPPSTLPFLILPQ